MQRTTINSPRFTLLRQSIFVACLIVSLASAALACPDIDGLVDINCDQQLVIVCFGDSITYSVGDELRLGGYPGRLKRNHFPNARVVNLGVSGEKTNVGRGRAALLLPRYPADYTLVLEGVNDYWQRGRRTNKTRDNDLSIINSARNTGAVALLSNLTAVRRSYQRGWVSSVNGALDPFKQINFFSLGEGIISRDLLHPNSSGYTRMAAHAAEVLQQISAVSRPVDSDGDGFYDFAEVRLGSNPFVADSDGDGVNDGLEYFTYRSSPLLLDSDGDSLSDNFEILQLGSNPADPRPASPRIESVEVVVP